MELSQQQQKKKKMRKKEEEEEDNSGRHKHNISSLNITKYYSASDKITIHAGDGQSLNCSPHPPN
jgi:hypothetical protein